MYLCMSLNLAQLTLSDMGFFEPLVTGGHNFVFVAQMIMKIGTGNNLDLFNTIATKKFVTSLLLRNYVVIAVF